MERITVKTKKKKEAIVLTDNIHNVVSRIGEKREKVIHGICHAFVRHTTCALIVADMDPGTGDDYIDAFSAMIPSLPYRHQHDPQHVGDHILSAMVGVSVFIPVVDGKLALGQWQDIVLLEFAGPREREILLSLYQELGE